MYVSRVMFNKIHFATRRKDSTVKSKKKLFVKGVAGARCLGLIVYDYCGLCAQSLKFLYTTRLCTCLLDIQCHSFAVGLHSVTVLICFLLLSVTTRVYSYHLLCFHSCWL